MNIMISKVQRTYVCSFVCRRRPPAFVRAFSCCLQTPPPHTHTHTHLCLQVSAASLALNPVVWVAGFWTLLYVLTGIQEHYF